MWDRLSCYWNDCYYMRQNYLKDITKVVTPKEYGMMLQRKRRKRGGKR